MAATKTLNRGGSCDTCIQFRLPVLRCRQAVCRAGSSFAPPRRASRRRRRSPRASIGEAEAAPRAAQAGRPILLKGGCVLSLDRAVGDFEQADVLIEGKKISAVRPNISAPNAQVIDASNAHRHAGLRRYPPAHVAGLPAQRAAGRLARGLHRNVVQRTFGAKMMPDDVYAADCISALGCHRCRRDLRARLVAHPEFARAHRRLHQGIAGIRRAGGVRLWHRPERDRPGNWKDAPTAQVSRRHRAAAQAVFLQRRPARHALSRGAGRRAGGDPVAVGRPPATSAPASPSMSASASSAATRSGEDQRHRAR